MAGWCRRPCAHLGTFYSYVRYEKGELSDHQFGFDGDNLWEGRRDALFQSLRSNPLAKFVTRAVQFGSEPLFDNVLSVVGLAEQITAAKGTLSSLKIPVTISELAYGYQEVKKNLTYRRFSNVDVLIARRGARCIECHRHN